MLLSNYKSDTIEVRSLLILSCFFYSPPSPPCTHLLALQRSAEPSHSPMKDAVCSPAAVSACDLMPRSIGRCEQLE